VGSPDAGGGLVCVPRAAVVTTGAPGPWWFAFERGGEMHSILVESERTCMLFLLSLSDPRVARGWDWTGVGCVASAAPPYPESSLERKRAWK
jgi:hypothetical protein